jgi:hypothetical protein
VLQQQAHQVPHVTALLVQNQALQGQVGQVGLQEGQQGGQAGEAAG